jgi:hypothetical protein
MIRRSIGMMMGNPNIAINVPLLEAFEAMLEIIVKLAEKTQCCYHKVGYEQSKVIDGIA